MDDKELPVETVKPEVTPAPTGHSGGKAQQATSYKHSDKYRKLRRNMAKRSRKINQRGKKSVK